MPELKWFPVPLEEAKIFFLKKAVRQTEQRALVDALASMPMDDKARRLIEELMASLQSPWSVFDARLHCAYLLNSGEITRWSMADLAVHWGWGRKAKASAKRVLDYVKRPANLWTLFNNLDQSASPANSGWNANGTMLERPWNDDGTQMERCTVENQGLTHADVNDVGTMLERSWNDDGTPHVRARGDLSSLIPRSVGREIRKSRDSADPPLDAAGAALNTASPTPPPLGGKRKRATMKKLPHDFEAQSVELASVMDQEKDPEVKRFLELLQRWSAAESPERWIVKPSEVVGWFRKEVLENRIGDGVDPIRTIQEWDEYLEDLADGRKGGRFPSATGWRTALRFQFERIPPFKRTYVRESEGTTEADQAHAHVPVKAPKQPVETRGGVAGAGKTAPPVDPYEGARRYLVLQVQRWNGYLDPETVIQELEARFQKGELLEAIRQWRDDEGKRKLDDEDKSDVKASIAFRVRNLQGNAATA